jgi:parvulin-like peptidyl-prolyl isomerase
VLSACGSSSVTTSASDAFTVEGSGYSTDEFNTVAQALIDAGQFTSTDGRIKTEDAITVLRTLVRHRAFIKFAQGLGIEITDADRAEVLENANKDEAFPNYPKALQDVLVDLNVADKLLQTVKVPAEDELKKLYNNSPATTGALCLSHILVETESAAKKVLEELKAGAKFADVAAKSSIEPGADKSGGALKAGEEDCQSLATLQTSFDPAFMVGAVNAKSSVPTGPIKSQFGFHIILNHEYEDVKQSVATVVATSPGNILLSGWITNAKISVNSKYGTWSGALATIS